MPDVCADVDRALSLVQLQAAKAGADGARVVCFPEAYLQGYVVEPGHVAQSAVDLSSIAFARILQQLVHLEPTIVLGLFEREGGRVFNSAVVLRHGRLLGRYRKRHLVGRENDIFTPGDESAVFELDDLTFGINICYDMQYAECATEAAGAGATLLICPANNMLRRQRAEEWKLRHNKLRSEHARASGLWLLSSDVTGTRGRRVSYGPTALIDPSGRVVEQLPLSQAGVLVVDVPASGYPDSTAV